MSAVHEPSSTRLRGASRGLLAGRVGVLLAIGLGVLAVYFGAPWVAAEASGAAYTHCMSFTDEGEGFGTRYRAFPVAGVECFTTSRPEGFYLGWTS